MTPRPQRRRPRLADVVADELRDDILNGVVPDGGLLPKQEELIQRFGVSPPSVREALRILETEGLVSVVRGNVGGAVVSLPPTRKVGYMLGLVLQAHHTTLDDVAAALQGLEALCAGTAARRPDREATVVQALRARVEQSRACFDDTEAYIASARAFHEDLVSGCGNETLALVAGAIEMLWSAHVATHATGPEARAPFEDLAFRDRTVHEHEAIVDAIAAGRSQEAATLAREHLGTPELHTFVKLSEPVQAVLLNDG